MKENEPMADLDQKRAFLEMEGDSYFQRNQERLQATADKIGSDRVLAALEAVPIEIRSVLEIGCSNGWRLDALHRRYGAKCSGIDPSHRAIAQGQQEFPGLALSQGTADELPFGDASFDLVIFGFCLYLCDRGDLFRIAMEADRVLADGGTLAILDFLPPTPYRNRYAHGEDLWSYKMDYARMFTWSPTYVVLSQSTFSHSGLPIIDDPDERLGVVLLRKDGRTAYPMKPSWAR
jgi:ubiquinone/menaquinone biosynthesis C-methylase UbiE